VQLISPNLDGERQQQHRQDLGRRSGGRPVDHRKVMLVTAHRSAC